MSTSNLSFDGGCTCGHVRYKMHSEPLIVHGCHCTLCQRQSGGSFAVNALIEADRVELTQGEVCEVLVNSPSGSGQKISRCPQCQVAVWSNYLVIGELVRFVRVGTLDNSAAFPPDVHIYTKTKHPWVILPPDTPAVETYYDVESTWRPESIRRREVQRAAARE